MEEMSALCGYEVSLFNGLFYVKLISNSFSVPLDFMCISYTITKVVLYS
jgi:hypothetical protein